ncbi:MAG TPA: hypothetical protein VII06_43150 [Chloroflexota bacterium]|jgi:hypothetical protein
MPRPLDGPRVAALWREAARVGVPPLSVRALAACLAWYRPPRWPAVVAAVDAQRAKRTPVPQKGA